MKLPIALGVGCMKGYWGVVRGSKPGMLSKSYKFELNFSSRKAAKETPETKVGYVAIDLKMKEGEIVMATHKNAHICPNDFLVYFVHLILCVCEG